MEYYLLILEASRSREKKWYFKKILADFARHTLVDLALHKNILNYLNK